MVQPDLPKKLEPEMLEKRIATEQYIHPEGTTMTICVLKLDNNFTVTGTSACVNPDLFDEEVGKKVAREKAVDKLWDLEGYLLRERTWLQNGE